MALDAAVFTNLSRDHLDYHGDIEAYFEAKKRLFIDLLPASRDAGKRGLAVICLDDGRGEALARAAAQKGLEVLTYGYLSNRPCDAGAKTSDLSLDGGTCRLPVGPAAPLRPKPGWWAGTTS